MKSFWVFRKVNETYYLPHFINITVHAVSGLEEKGEGVGTAISSVAAVRVWNGRGLRSESSDGNVEGRADLKHNGQNLKINWIWGWSQRWLLLFLFTWALGWMDGSALYQDKECQDKNRFMKEDDEFYLNMMTWRSEMYNWRCQVGSWW